MKSWALLSPLLLAGCSPQGLQGSLSVILDLTYQSSDLAIANDQASLRFLRATPNGGDAGGGVGAQDLVLKVTTTLSGQPLVPHTYFDLAELLPNGAQRGQLSRNITGEPPPAFPLINRGDFYVRGTPKKGDNVSGYFTITFQEGIQEASGRTVYGSFSAKVL
jgi:hypothetical protein